MRFSGGKGTSFVILIPRKLVFRFMTSIALGVSYGRRISDLKDEMVSFNYNSGQGKRYKTFPERDDPNRCPQNSSGEFGYRGIV
jgi:hypothetical protein